MLRLSFFEDVLLLLLLSDCRMYTKYFSEGLDSVKFSGQIAGFKSPGWEPSAATQVKNLKTFLKKIIFSSGKAGGRGGSIMR